jgi:hypothetical protein
MSLFRRTWRRLMAARYTRALEAEVARQGVEIHRLRAENRALLNSILGIAGIPPVLVAGDAPPVSSLGTLCTVAGHDPRHSGDHQPQTISGECASLPDGSISASPSAGDGIATRLRSRAESNLAGESYSVPRQIASPMRRRSWHQISRRFEFEAARKREAGESV